MPCFSYMLTWWILLPITPGYPPLPILFDSLAFNLALYVTRSASTRRLQQPQVGPLAPERSSQVLTRHVNVLLRRDRGYIHSVKHLPFDSKSSSCISIAFHSRRS
ncbi:uncharacterized protein B0J16DRAFT_345349 [Fusarium flagelliforme]|uniref:uncharacterized protein n=1 Tax=Fusarium flagelliforme TaxID=2675880 RepID=UPI001E8E129C|nr:uncharacterized protein B0J16DRAFT_345349 [Fusarium flagelliforme]KAH7183094.1 hypothetical protein B0J16DRAFT_345349 [Fusarium flagelliforme]